MPISRRPAYRIGLDLDNTLIDYDALFVALAKRRSLVPADFAGGKRDLRDFVRERPDGELDWQQLQAQAYGPEILGARPAAGARAFIEEARRRGAEMAIVSHKSERAAGAPDGTNLREAARAWLLHHGLIGPHAIPAGGVYFEHTRDEKVARIADLGCTHFVDDLEEVFDHPAFPARTQRYLLSVTAAVPNGPYAAYRSFLEISREIFGD